MNRYTEFEQAVRTITTGSGLTDDIHLPINVSLKGAAIFPISNNIAPSWASLSLGRLVGTTVKSMIPIAEGEISRGSGIKFQKSVGRMDLDIPTPRTGGSIVYQIQNETGTDFLVEVVILYEVLR